MLKPWCPPPETPEEILLAVDDPEGELAEDWRNDNTCSELTVGAKLTSLQTTQLHDLLHQFCSILNDKPGRTMLAEHSITLADTKPVRQKPYRIPKAFETEVNKDIQEMLDYGIIEPSNSAWRSPLVVRKKDDTARLCVDYRRLNSVTELDAYPFPRIDDILDTIGQANFITTLDLAKGYWQVPVAE